MKKNIKTFLKLTLILVISIIATIASLLSAQPSQIAAPNQEEGLPLIKTFSAKEYDANIQNWAIEQAPNGMIYVGNTEGVLEFDGIRWRLIPVSNGTIVRSLSVDPSSGRIYVGAVGELGYLEADSQGKMQYVSMLPLLNGSQKEFADVWKTYVNSRGVFFSSFQRLFLIKDNKVKTWEPENSFHFSFQIGDRLLIREVGKGISELINDQLVLISQGEKFANERVYELLPWTDIDPEGLLIVTRSDGLYLQQNGILSRFVTEIDKQLNQDLLYAAGWLPDGRLALCTLQGGLYIFDKQGNWLKTLNRDFGLPDNAVAALKVDKDDGIWLALTRGIVRIEANNSISYFNDRAGLETGAVLTREFNNNLYVGATSGLYRLNKGPQASFVRVEGIQNQIWDILPVEDRLLIANYLGIYQIKDTSAELVFSFDSVFSFALAKDNPNKVFVGLRNGINVIRLEGGKWINDGLIPGVDGEIRSILQLKDGTLWIGTYTTGVIRIIFEPDGSTQVTYFGEAQGLPNINANLIHEFEDKPIFLTQKGIYQFNEEIQRFTPEPRFKQMFGKDNRQILSISADPLHGLWIITGIEETRLTQVGLAVKTSSGDYIWQTKALDSIKNYLQNSIFRDSKGVLWLAGNEGLFRFDPNQQKIKYHAFEVLLRKVIKGDGEVLFSGAGYFGSPILDFGDNRLRFEFAALSFNGMEDNLFQVKLDDADANWSQWSREAFKDYSNLWEGQYQLQLRAKNRAGIIQESKIYSFTILPPWYRSIWAYFCYLLIIASVIWSMMRWREGRLQAQKRLLRTQIEDRTKQLAMLGAIGRDITATLDLDHALESVYNNINNMLDARVFGIGLYHQEKAEIEFRLAIENGQRYQPYTRKMADKNQLSVWCVEHNESVMIGNYLQEYTRYFATLDEKTALLIDGSDAKQPLSILYVPILFQNLVLGVLTVQSFEAFAYRKQHLDLLQTLASYTAIAIDNGRVHADLMIAYNMMAEVSVTDQLTGLKNRRFLEQHIKEDINQSLRHYSNLKFGITDDLSSQADHIFFILDLDHFKRVNDTYGHAAGDRVLINIKNLLCEVFRDSDFLIRWGGEEFLAMTRFTQRSSAENLAERIRIAIESHEFDIGDDQSIKMTASIGFAAFPFYPEQPDLLTWQQVVNIADQCLYVAKNNQRNAWVGGIAKADVSPEQFISQFGDNSQDLINDKQISLSSSITKLNY